MPIDWYTPRALFNFRWRASRREYFLIQLLGLGGFFLLSIVAPVFASASNGPIGGAQTVILLLVMSVQSVGWIAILVVMLAAAVRRMHDQEKTAWLLLLGFVPLVGWIFQLVFVFTRGDEMENRYGPNPRCQPRPGRVGAADLQRVFD